MFSMMILKISTQLYNFAKKLVLCNRNSEGEENRQALLEIQKELNINFNQL